MGSMNSALVHYSRIPQTLLFINFFIKNGSHSTIHTFKNYFATVFSVFSFSKISSIQIDPKYRFWSISSLHTQFGGNKIRNHVLYPTPLIALEISNKEGAPVGTVFFPPSICMPNPGKPKKYHFFSMGSQEHI